MPSEDQFDQIKVNEPRRGGAPTGGKSTGFEPPVDSEDSPEVHHLNAALEEVGDAPSEKGAASKKKKKKKKKKPTSNNAGDGDMGEYAAN